MLKEISINEISINEIRKKSFIKKNKKDKWRYCCYWCW